MKKIPILLLLGMIAVSGLSAAPVSLNRLEAENGELSAENSKVVTLPIIYSKQKATAVKLITSGWVKFANVDFAKGRYKSVRLRMSTKDIRKVKRLVMREGDLTGKKLLDTKVLQTNNDGSFITKTVSLDFYPKGKKDIYCIFEGDANVPCNLDWIEFSTVETKGAKSIADFFLPMKPVSPLTKDVVWGDSNVIPRDVSNGIEGVIDGKLKWCYWDGGVVQSPDGKYHMYCSRWSQAFPHGKGWKVDSKAIHAVSDNIMGPYKDMGTIWDDVDNSKASNVFGFTLHDGRYGVVTSEITEGMVFVSDSANGPFKKLGEIKVDYNGKPKGYARYGTAPYHMSNVQIIKDPSGKGYRLIGRSTAVMISEDSVLGPYKIVSDPVYKSFPDMPQGYNEDPTMWYSGGVYHIVYNHWPSRVSHHYVSRDGIKDWIYCGEAFNHGETEIFRYTDGTINDWPMVQRPTVIMGKDGHPTHFLFSVLDILKGNDLPNDKHASKIVVVPFDGKAFDKYVERRLKEEGK